MDQLLRFLIIHYKHFFFKKYINTFLIFPTGLWHAAVYIKQCSYRMEIISKHKTILI